MNKRLVVPVAAVLGVVALTAPGALAATSAGASPAQAAPPPVTWSAKKGPVPHAATGLSPALTFINFPGRKSDAVLLWAGPRAKGRGYRISFEAAVSLGKDKWSAPGLVDNGAATTLQRPSAAPFGGASSNRIIVVWTGTGPLRRVFYSVGTARRGGQMSWSPATPIPGATSTDGPTVFTPLHSDVVFVAWRGAKTNYIDYIVGTPAPGSPRVRWGSQGAIPPPPGIAVVPPPQTSQSPAVTEVSTSPGTGVLYVLWRVPGDSGELERASTADPVSITPTWGAIGLLPPDVTTGGAPAAMPLGTSKSYPLLIAYRALNGNALLYVTLTTSVTGTSVDGPFTVPDIRSPDGPATSGGFLFANVLGASRPDVDYAAGHICPRC